MQLFSILEAIVSLDQQHKDEISELIVIREYKKNEIFINRGNRSDFIGFVMKGSFRFVIEIDGNERTFDFALENDFISDYYGILKSLPASFDIIANHPSKVACLPTAKVMELFDRDMVYQKIARTIAETEFCRNHERITSLMYDPPQVRYEKLLKVIPDVGTHLPQHILANYMGITKETLSRIRSKLVR